MTSPENGSAGSGGLRADPDFVRFWLARQVSIAGSLVTALALPVLIYRVSGSAPLTALVAVLEGLPWLLFGLIAGAVSDRVNRRRLMVGADLANILVVGSVPLAYAADRLTLPHVLIAAFAAQAIFVFFDAGALGALPTLVGRERIGQANAAIWGFGGLLDLLVPMAVGVALAVVDPAALLALDALSFLLSAGLVVGIRRPLTGERARTPLRAGRLVAEVRAGLAFLGSHGVVRTQTLIGMLQSFGGAGFMALAVPYADRLLGVGTSGWRFGMLFAAWGVGGILAAFLVGAALRRWSSAWVTLVALPVSAMAGLVVVRSSSWLVAIAAMVVWGISYQAVIIASVTNRQEATPEPLLGRVNTVGRMLSFGVGWTGGALVAGALAAQIGLRPAMTSIVAAISVAAFYAWFSPLRKAERVRFTAGSVTEQSPA